MTISFKRLALAGGVAASAVALSASAHAEGWTGGYISVGVSGASSSADVSATVAGSNSLVVNDETITLTGTPATKLGFVDDGIAATTNTYVLGTSSGGTVTPSKVLQHVLDIKSGAAGRATNRFRAGLILEGGYDYEVANSLVLGLNASYTFSGTATSENVSGLGSAVYSTQSGSLTATSSTAGVSPDVTAVKLGTGVGTAPAAQAFDIYNLTSAGTFVPATTGTAPNTVVTPAAVKNSASVGTQTRFRMGDNFTVGARAGFAASSNLLLFVAGGYTKAEVGVSATSSVVKGAADGKDIALKEVSGKKWKDGYYLGGGFEAKVTGNISLKAEYRYSDYGNYSITGARENVTYGTLVPAITPAGIAPAAATPAPVETLSAPVTTTVSAKSIQSHALRVSVAYRF